MRTWRNIIYTWVYVCLSLLPCMYLYGSIWSLLSLLYCLGFGVTWYSWSVLYLGFPSPPIVHWKMISSTHPALVMVKIYNDTYWAVSLPPEWEVYLVCDCLYYYDDMFFLCIIFLVSVYTYWRWSYDALVPSYILVLVHFWYDVILSSLLFLVTWFGLLPFGAISCCWSLVYLVIFGPPIMLFDHVHHTCNPVVGTQIYTVVLNVLNSSSVPLIFHSFGIFHYDDIHCWYMWLSINFIVIIYVNDAQCRYDDWFDLFLYYELDSFT